MDQATIVGPSGDEFDGRIVVHAPDYTSPFETGSFPENASWVGAYDMAGNVREWTTSGVFSYPYDLDDGREPAGDVITDPERIVRGGSYNEGRDGAKLLPSVLWLWLLHAGYWCALRRTL